MKTYTDYSEICLDVQRMFKQYYNHSLKSEWVEAAKLATDITLRWQKMYGYVPASEQASYKKKWADFREVCAKTLDDVEPPFKHKEMSQLTTQMKDIANDRARV